LQSESQHANRDYASSLHTALPCPLNVAMIPTSTRMFNKRLKNELRERRSCMNRELLEKPFSPEQIKRRQGTNGDVLDYIEGCAVIQRLNECFDAEWIFEIQEHRVYDDEVVVLGRLTAQSVAKSQFGKSRITRSQERQFDHF